MRNYGLVLILLISGLFSACTSVPKLSLGSLTHGDEALRESIQASIASNEIFANAKPINIEVHQSSVLLSGYVKTIRQSDVAADIATKTPGVRTVENNLIVKK